MAIAFVRTALIGGSTSSPLVDSITVDAGDCMVMRYGFLATSCSITGVTDSNLNTWQRGTTNQGDGTGIFTEIWYTLNMVGGFTVVSTVISFSGLTETLGRFSEFSGVATVGSPEDGSNSKVNTATTAHGTGAVSVTRENVLVGGISYRPGGGSPSLDGGSGYNSFGANPDSGGGGILNQNAYRVAAAGSNEPTWTLGAAATGIGQQIALHGPVAVVPTLILPKQLRSRRTSW